MDKIVIETIYRECTVTDIDPITLTILHSGGIARLELAKLSEPLQKKFGYDAAKAAAYTEEMERAQKNAVLPPQPAAPTFAPSSKIEELIARSSSERQAKQMERAQFDEIQRQKIADVLARRDQEAAEAARRREEANENTRKNVEKAKADAKAAAEAKKKKK